MPELEPEQMLLVCTGNVCRSPYMELFLRACVDNAASSHEVRFVSAGTSALVGAPMDASMAVLLPAGITASGFRARQLTARLVHGSQLIITAERAHRAQVLALQPSAHRKVFSLRQAARLLALTNLGGSIADIARGMAAMRGRAPGSNDDDVTDPYLGPPAVYAEAAVRMSDPLLLLGRRIAAGQQAGGS